MVKWHHGTVVVWHHDTVVEHITQVMQRVVVDLYGDVAIVMISRDCTVNWSY